VSENIIAYEIIGTRITANDPATITAFPFWIPPMSAMFAAIIEIPLSSKLATSEYGDRVIVFIPLYLKIEVTNA